MNVFNTSEIMSPLTLNIKKYNILLVLGLAALLAGCAGLGSANLEPSSEVQRFIRKYRIDDYTLDVALMPRWTASPSIPVRRGQGEMYRLPQERVSLEAFIFDVYYDRAQGLFWVKRTSPAASLEENYGPVKISEVP
jgi:hypothetical protein